jgi:hypothetical protein
LIEILVQIVLETVAELGFTSARAAFGRTNQGHPAWAVVAIALVGIAVGALTAWLVPHRVLPRPPVAGLSLVIGPIAVGGAMHLLGRAESKHGRARSRLATFWGGALFAFSFSLVRFLLLPE